jgi:Initiator Replication protein
MDLSGGSRMPFSRMIGEFLGGSKRGLFTASLCVLVFYIWCSPHFLSGIAITYEASGGEIRRNCPLQGEKFGVQGEKFGVYPQAASGGEIRLPERPFEGRGVFIDLPLKIPMLPRMNKKNSTLPLFSEAALNQPVPTGSPWDINPVDPATVPVPLQVIIVNVQGPYTEMDRKLWTFLLHAVWDELDETTVRMHELSVSSILSVFRDVAGTHDASWIWQSAKRLAKTTIEFEYTMGDTRCQGIDNLFGAMLTKEARSSGRLKFYFPPLLVPIIKQPSRFARLRVHFLIQLSGKYAVSLYEILEGFINRKDRMLNVSIDDLRQWLKVPEESYKDWKDFRKWVLDPAVKQINDDPEGAGFSVTYTPHRAGRFYNSITFTMTKTEQRTGIERGVKKKLDLAKRIAGAGRPVLRSDVYAKARKAAAGLDIHNAEHEFWAFWEAKGRKELKSPEGAFINFCKRKAKALQ